MATLVQQSSWAEGEPAAPTISAATSGNLLISVCGERSGATAVTTPSGWTKLFEDYANAGDGTYRRSMAGFYKVAAGGETTVSLDFNSSGTVKGKIYEYALEGGSGEDQWVFMEAVTANSGATDDTASPAGTPLGSGNTSALSFTRALALAFWFGKQSNGSSLTYTDLAFSNDPSTLDTPSYALNGRSMGAGYGTATTDGVKSTTASWSNSDGDSRSHIVALAYFDLVSGGGGGLSIPVASYHYSHH